MNTEVLANPIWIILSVLILTMIYLASKQSSIKIDNQEKRLASKYSSLSIAPLLAVGVAIVFLQQSTPEMVSSCECDVLQTGLREHIHRIWAFLP